MLHKYHIFSLTLLLQIIPTIIYTQQRLSDFNFGSASVLPFFIKNNKKYFILSREAAGTDKGTYDDFGGSREPKETHPLMTAAHEFLEEAMLEFVLGFSLKDTQKCIDVKSAYTETIIAFSRNVAYIVDFTDYIDTFFNNFYTARHKLTKLYVNLKAKEHTPMTLQEKKDWNRRKKYYWARIEKDRLAIIECDTLCHAIVQNKNSTRVIIDAQVLNPHNLTWNTKQITLRPYFVKKLHPFFMNKPFHQGLSKKIRFYDIDPTKTAIDPTDTTCAIYIKSQEKCKTKIIEPQKSWFTRLWNWIKSEN